MKLRDAERSLFDLLVASVQRYIPLSVWRLDGREKFLPVRVQAEPGRIYEFVGKARVPSSEHRWFAKFVLSGNATLEVDGRLVGGIDEAHTYFPLDPGLHELRIRASPRGMFGFHDWSLSFEKAFLAEVYWRGFSLALKLLSLVSYLKSLPPDDAVRRRVEGELFDALMSAPVSPSVLQITVALSLLYEGGRSFSRGDLPERYGDYAWLSGVYGAGILGGRLRDVGASSLDDVKRACDRLEPLLSLLEELRKSQEGAGELFIVGHSHIDAAWLWPVQETREKVARTFANVVSLLREYGGPVYAQSSALYYEWVEEDYPELFREIKRLVESGRWIPVGGMWVESDVQLVEGESLARQFLYGQRYFYSRFGRTARIGWIPDSFGFPYSLPQLLVKSGLECFVTHKVLWNDTNEFPYHSFLWRGVDGSTIPVQILLNSYNEMLTPGSVKAYWSRYKQRGEVPFLPYAYGYGDGGGGPTREMLESLDVVKRLPGLPRLRHLEEEEYLARLKASEGSMPVWDGELYVEFHRGTYTTNLQVKELMWRAELALLTAEEVASLASSRTGEGLSARLERLWKTLLLHQFHDILPGSSMKEVYEDAYRDLSMVLREASSLAREALEAYLGGGEGGVAVFNPLPWPRRAIVSLPMGMAPRGAECQESEEGVLVEVELPPAGYRVYSASGGCVDEGEPLRVEEVDGGILLSSGAVEVVVDRDGSLGSVRLLPGGEEVLSRPSNQLRVHFDRPGVFDAWELTDDFLSRWEEARTLSEPRLVERGRLRACVEYVKGFGKSRVTQRVCVYRFSPVVEVKTRLEWFDKGFLVKAWMKPAFKPTAAVFETPYGVVYRSPAWASSIDRAKFEAPALRWVDVSDGARGFAVIAPGRHGYSVREDYVSLSLLKSPTFPNPWSDVGEFETTYYIYPHLGGYEEARVAFVAAELLRQPLAVATAPVERSESFLSVNPPEALLGAFKAAEDGDGYVMRLYNPHRGEVEVEVEVNVPFREAVEVDIPELRVLGRVEVSGGKLRLRLKPFEVKTVKLR
ncbi:alpha-mannosidase [Thermofilum pendens]|uniref:Glycoside hydrolase, family 38 n=1 Tax=Thermofilum pendens (strain DSM 2475 / Hrk 5) TaxID=368408 RepID=A1S0P3_THEPD|nr:glycoside hydrolase family 38 C-terminal domain-containing protein [Thermofilum pendens]ABL79023.1 glycoside hydrolase, family 38 [Thermofilum pendens Hrk 5]